MPIVEHLFLLTKISNELISTVSTMGIVDIFSIALFSFIDWIFIIFLLMIVHETSHLFWFIVSGNKITRFNIGLIDLIDDGNFHFKLKWKSPFSGCCIVNAKKNNGIVILGLLSGGLSGLLIAFISLLIGNGTYNLYVRLFCIYACIAGVISFVMTLVLPKSQDHIAINKLKKRNVNE